MFWLHWCMHWLKFHIHLMTTCASQINWKNQFLHYTAKLPKIFPFPYNQNSALASTVKYYSQQCLDKNILLYVVKRPLWGNKLTWVQISAYLIDPNTILSTATASTRVTSLQKLEKLGWMLPLQQKHRLSVNSSVRLFFRDQPWQISSIKPSMNSVTEITLHLADSMPSNTALTTSSPLHRLLTNRKIRLHHCHQR